MCVCVCVYVYVCGWVRVRKVVSNHKKTRVKSSNSVWKYVYSVCAYLPSSNAMIMLQGSDSLPMAANVGFYECKCVRG